MKDPQKVKVLTHNVSIISKVNLIEQAKKFSFSNKGHYICLTPVHAIIEANNDDNFSNAVNNADLCLPDGRPVYWALKLLNYQDAEYFPGYYVTKIICKLAAENKIKVGFYGGKSETLNKCKEKLINEFKELDISYIHSPPFRNLTNMEKKTVIDDINKSEIKFLFVCLGCPKQEFWMSEHKETIKCTKIGIGAAIEFIAGKSYLPPKWIQKIGLWWLIRLILEPRRLFWRYFSTNFKFIFLFLKQLVKQKSLSNEKK